LIPKIIAGRPGLLAGSFPIELGDPDATAGKDADLALFDGDPFEYTTHCTGVVIDGAVVANAPR
jgi:hypothetical protein